MRQTYYVKVTETLTRSAVYAVDANSIDDAKDMAVTGETIYEYYTAPEEIITRDIESVKERP